MVDVVLRRVIGLELEEEILLRGRRFVIGRAVGCDLRPDCPLVSRYHCELIVDEDKVMVHDLESKNGTFVNDEQVVGARILNTGDRLAVGMRVLHVEISRHTPDLSAVPPLLWKAAG